MEIVKIAATGILTAVSVLIIKEYRKDMAVLIGICGSVVLVVMIVAELANIIDAMSDIASKTGISSTMFSQILKIIGIGYITEFSANICEDSGIKSVADKIQLGGKVLIMIVALPIITSIIDIVISVLP